MDLLRTAVVDITTLVATCRALRTSRLEGDLAEHGKLRNRIRVELKRGTVAYIDTLARSKRGVVNADLLSACRVAAERQMLRAVRYQAELNRLMVNEPGVLNGVAAARQDLWRLAHMAIYLRIGCAALRDMVGNVDLEATKPPGSQLRRRFRRALIAYARASHRGKEGKEWVIVAARNAALAEIGKRGMEEVNRLGELEARGGSTQTVIRNGVARPLRDLILDWRQAESGSN
jgi:hypothetical protein